MTLEHLEFGSVEPYITIPQAAKILGIPVSTLRRAVNAGLINTYTPFSTRKRVILSEVEAVIAEQKVRGRTDG